jgi:hypothetical protein
MNKPIDTTEEFKQMLINMSISQIQHNMTDPIITIWDDGTYSISDNSFVDGRSITISVMAESPFTTQNGYKIDNGKLIAPNGTVIFPDVR